LSCSLLAVEDDHQMGRSGLECHVVFLSVVIDKSDQIFANRSQKRFRRICFGGPVRTKR